MGAWGFGIFDDDTAYDFTPEIKADARAFFRSAFEGAIASDHVDYDSGHRVTVSAAYMDNLLNGTTYRTDSHEERDEANVNLFRQLHPSLEVGDLRPLAVDALRKVIAEASELNELWSEADDYPGWRKTIEDLIERLQ